MSSHPLQSMCSYSNNRNSTRTHDTHKKNIGFMLSSGGTEAGSFVAPLLCRAYSSKLAIDLLFFGCSLLQ